MCSVCLKQPSIGVQGGGGGSDEAATQGINLAPISEVGMQLTQLVLKENYGSIHSS